MIRSGDGDLMVHEIFHSIQDVHISGQHPANYNPSWSELNFDTFEVEKEFQPFS
jgi:hypothetical protein